jgi:hypothetical protein
MISIAQRTGAGVLALTTMLIVCGPAGAETLGAVSTGDKIAVIGGAAASGALIGTAMSGGRGAIIGGAGGAYAATVGYDRYYDRRDGYYDRWGVFHYYDRYYRRDWDDHRFRRDWDDRRYRRDFDDRHRRDRDDRYRR